MIFTRLQRLGNTNLKNNNFFCVRHGSFFFILVTLLLFYTCKAKQGKGTDFNHFVFSQRWLPSSCIEYIESDDKSERHCILPQNYTFWAVHGLWPTKEDTLGPFFCNKSMKFNLKALEPIEPILKVVWPNIEDGHDFSSLWEHEWLKHGTCAAVLESLNSEIKFFNTSLGLYSRYNINSLFLKYNFLPSNNTRYDVLSLYNAVKETFLKSPRIHCITEKKSNVSYLSEIRICLNKNLELIDCDKINVGKDKKKRSHGHSFTNCPKGKDIIIPNKADSSLFHNEYLEENFQSLRRYKNLIDILQLIRFLQWASL